MAAFSLLAIVFRAILCMWPRPGGPNRIADSMPRASLDCYDAIDPCLRVLEVFLGSYTLGVCGFGSHVPSRCPSARLRPSSWWGEGRRAGHQIFCRPPSPQPAPAPAGSESRIGRSPPWTLTVWPFLGACFGYGAPAAASVSPANGSSKLQGIELTTSRTRLGSRAVVNFALVRRYGSSLPPSVPPFHLRRHPVPPISDRPPMGPMPYLIQCHHPHACRRGPEVVCRDESHMARQG